MSSIKKMFVESGRRLCRSLIGPVVKEQLQEIRAELLAHHYLSRLEVGFVPGTTAALRPSIVMAAINDIALHGRKHVVECGAGTSTVYLAKALAQFGGTLTTVENDEGWLRQVESWTAANGLASTVKFVLAPLAPSPFSLEGSPWYDSSVLDSQIRQTVDLLVVDGPGIGPARYGAIPYFANKLSRDFAIIADDVPRGTGNLIPQWEEKLGVPFRRLGDFALASTSPEFKIFVAPV